MNEENQQTPQNNHTSDSPKEVTVSVRCMNKLVWEEIVIQAKINKQNMNVYMENLLIDHLDKIGVDVSNLQ